MIGLRAQVLLALAVSGMVGFLGCAPASFVSEPPPVRPAAFALGPGDVVEIRVYRENDLNGVYRVGSDGTIDFPLIGKVQLVHKRPEDVQQEVRARLGEGYLVDPQVVVFVRERNSQKVHVMGEVNRAGTFPYEDGMSVIQAITNAGGFTKLASKNGVTVTRILAEGGSKTFRVPVGDIGTGRAGNFRLNPGDIVSVPEALF